MIQIDNPLHRYIAWGVDLVGRIIFKIFFFLRLKKRKDINLAYIKPKRILVIEMEPIGDVIMALPVFHALRKKFPYSNITALVGPWAKDILLNNPYIDEILLENSPWAFSDLIIGWRGFKSHIVYFLKYIKFLRVLKRRKFDLAIDLRGDFRNFLFYIFFPNIKYSLSYSRTGGDYLITRAVPFDKNKHEVEKNIVLLRYLGIDNIEKRIEIFPRQEDFKKIEKIFKEKGVKESDFICVIHPGSRRKVKLWPPERYSRIADFLWKEYKAKIILTGSRQDQSLVSRIKKYLDENTKVIDLSGQLNLLEMAALLKKVDLLICPDTGIMHLASAFSLPTVALFGPGDPQQTAPLNENAYLVDKNFPCRPCLQKKCKFQNSEFSACMEAITVEEVKKAIKRCKEKIKNHSVKVK